ncbi:hypothetical protein CEXT_365951 [Caerostris extrusa]|uniref:Uncharacterized protein n=1 Tax=Caerostris extrusa TaxID=172846 RepID=A0AAV4TYB0_CAEEX|nr:hypothetical protein CEXT_365951 [Caerostris extrusa]
MAVRYLEIRLPQLRDPYQVALVTYALLEARSVEAEVGFYRLDSMKKKKKKRTHPSCHHRLNECHSELMNSCERHQEYESCEIEFESWRHRVYGDDRTL